MTNCFKTLLAATTALAISTFAASAADMRPAYKAAAPVAPAFSWSGFYVGGVIGGGLMNSEFMDAQENLSYGFMQKSKWGFTAGATLGYNWQSGPAVFGIEGDFNWTNLDQTFNNYYYASTFNTQWNWFATLRARAGIAVDRALFYVTGGLAFVDADYLAVDPSYGCVGNYCASSSSTQTGFTAGVGAEYAFAPNWSAKLEYLYVGLPTKDVGDSYYTTSGYLYNFKSDAHFLRVGLNYRFGDYGKSPVVARY